MGELDDTRPFFTEAGEELIPAPHAHSPWSETMLHGRLLGGLMARAIEREHAAEGLHFARLTIDLFRGSPLVPVRVGTGRIRDGRRIRIADAQVGTEAGVIARASAVLLRRGEQPAGEVWAPPVWNVPTPDELGESGPSPSAFELWPISPAASDAWNSPERRRIWVREIHPLVGTESSSPLVRVALAADMASPMAHAGSSGLYYINADYTLTLSRLPLGDVIGIEAAGHLSDEGVAVGQCTLYDVGGPIGYCGTTALAYPGGLNRS